MNSDTNYIYSGVPITPQVISHLTKELFGGKLVQRQVIIEQVLAEHIKRGGLPPNVSDFSASVKKALADMQEAGDAENPSLGYWKILPTDAGLTPETTGNADLTVSPETEVVAPAPDDSIADLVLGTGPGSVYLYYLSTYRARAEERQEISWPCKIGRTEQNP